MKHEFEAIYENGVLRPLTPIGLRENEVVSVSVSPADHGPATSAIAARQRDQLLAFVAKMEALADSDPADGYSNRDHDQLIYGKPR